MSATLAPGPSGLQALRFLRRAAVDPLHAFLDLHREYGPAARIGGPVQQCFFFRAVAAEQVLVAQNKSFRKGILNAQFKVLDGLGLVTSEGDLWVRQRRTVQPSFSRQRLAALGAVMVHEASRLVTDWSRRPPQVFDVVPDLMKLTLQSASRTLFGVDLSRRSADVGPAVDTARTYITWRMSHFYVPAWVPTPLAMRFRAAKRLLDELVYALIQQRRRDGTSGRSDLLSTLVEAQDPETHQRMDDRQVRDEVMTLLMAGHESTAVMLSWALFLIGRHPEVQAKLATEIGQVLGSRRAEAADVPRLQYVRQVLDETLRLYPPVWAMSRQANSDLEVDGYRVPKNAFVNVVQYAVHRDPDLWPEPERFQPDWFAAEAQKARPPLAYFPFGAGPRACIGNHFALMEATLVLATILQGLSIYVSPEIGVDLEPQISLRRRGGIPAQLKPR